MTPSSPMESIQSRVSQLEDLYWGQLQSTRASDMNDLNNRMSSLHSLFIDLQSRIWEMQAVQDRHDRVLSVLISKIEKIEDALGDYMILEEKREKQV